MMQRRSIAALPLSGHEIEKAIGDGRAADHATVLAVDRVFARVAATIQTACISGIRKRGVERVSRVQCVVVEEAVDRAMYIVLSRTGNGIDHGAGVPPELGRKSCSHDLKFFNALGTLWRKCHETLTADADVLIIVIGAVNGEVVVAAPQAIHCKLTHRAHTDADGRSFTRREWWTRDSGGEECQVIERAGSRQWQVLDN